MEATRRTATMHNGQSTRTASDPVKAILRDMHLRDLRRRLDFAEELLGDLLMNEDNGQALDDEIMHCEDTVKALAALLDELIAEGER
jgi:hypothetical protein